MASQSRFIGGLRYRQVPIAFPPPLAELTIDGTLITIRVRFLLGFLFRDWQFEARDLDYVKYGRWTQFVFVLRTGRRAYFATLWEDDELKKSLSDLGIEIRRKFKPPRAASAN